MAIKREQLGPQTHRQIAQYRSLQTDRQAMNRDTLHIAAPQKHPLGRDEVERKMVQRRQPRRQQDRPPIIEQRQSRQRHEEEHMRVHLPPVPGQQEDAKRRLNRRQSAHHQANDRILTMAQDHDGGHDIHQCRYQQHLRSIA